MADIDPNKPIPKVGAPPSTPTPWELAGLPMHAWVTQNKEKDARRSEWACRFGLAWITADDDLATMQAKLKKAVQAADLLGTLLEGASSEQDEEMPQAARRAGRQPRVQPVPPSA